MKGHSLAKSLAGSGIETSVISDAAVFATMSRVNKVLIGTHTVLADGGLKAVCGMQIVAQCAKFFSVPVSIMAALKKVRQMALVVVTSHEEAKASSVREILIV